MARTEQKIRGRVGNMIFYQVKGQTRVRSAPMSLNSSNTPKQQLVRKRFIVLIRFYQRMKEPLLSLIWKLATQQMIMSGYNLFMQQNIHVFNDCTLHDPANLLLTTGILPPMSSLEITRQERGRVTLVWENSLNMEGVRAKDLLEVVVLFENRMFTPIRLENCQAYRGDRTVTLDLGGEKKRVAHLYCFFVSLDKQAYSPSCYVSTTLNKKS